MVYATSDLHGFPLDEFKTLLKKGDFTDEDFLFILGDVIDRNGDGGVEMLQWIMEQSNVQMLMGNHEAMMLSCGFVFDEITDLSIKNLDEDKVALLMQWMQNGAEPTINALYDLRAKDAHVLRDILDFIAELPLYDSVSTDAGDFLLVHGGIENFSPERSMDDYSVHELVWHRPDPEERFFPDIMTVMGHTPTRFYGSPNRMFRAETWIDIDTGAAGGGKPMLLRLDDMKEFYLR